jgi:hypothetical protein
VPLTNVAGAFGNRRYLFNVDFHGDWHMFDNLPDGTIDSPSLTVFVVLERDDGFEFYPPFDMHNLILEGTSTLP